MKIGIDTFGCDHGRSGLGSYLLSLVPNLPLSNPDIQYNLFGSEMDRYTYSSDKGFAFSSINVPDSLFAERFWHRFMVNSFAKKQGYDVVLYTAGARMLPNSFKVPGVAVINDIMSMLISEADDFFTKFQMKKSLSACKTIIATSKFIKHDLENLGISEKKIEVIYNGIDHTLFFPKEHIGLENEAIDIKPFAIKRPYLVYASRMQNESKKHIELIKAFTLFKERTHLPHRLVIAGSESLYGEQVHKAAFASSAASDIFITGYFPHEHFPELYRNADACIFPSIKEGVGLPVLEAMATGLPVACSDSGALPEITGENALLFDSSSPESISSAIEKIVCNADLRKKLIEDGLEWSKRFSWEKTCKQTLKILLSAAEAKK